jgi:homocysteine S-methyltransferase
MGPLGVRIEPWGKTGIDEAEAAFREQAAALHEGGVDVFILETFRDLNELKAAVRAVRAVSDRPVIAEMTTEDDGNSLDGTPPETFAPELERAGADVIGVNCSVGPAAMLETIERMAGLTRARLVAQPNAGRPRDVDGRNLYLSSPEYLATYARRFIAAGVRIVGGCCGTTSEHIRQIKAAVRASGPAAPRRAHAPAREGHAEPMPPVERRDKSNLARALADDRFATVTEVAAPRGLDLSSAVGHANRQHELGAVAVSITDYPKTGARASALALGVLIEQQSHVETLLHYSCRDRNLIGMQSDLLGAHAMGLRNVLLTTGEPPRQGSSYADATSVFDVDAIGLVNMVAQLNRGLDIGGQSIGAPTRFHIGVAVNPFSATPDTERRRLGYKVDAGAEFIMTPPILDLDAFDRALPVLRETGLPILAGVVALDSLRQAEFLASEVVGVQMPERVLARLRAASDAAAEGLAITREIVDALRGRVQGIHITGLHGQANVVEVLLEAELSRP